MIDTADFIYDWSALWQDPRMLSLADKNYSVNVPRAILKEIEMQNNRRSKEIIIFVNEAEKFGRLKIWEDTEINLSHPLGEVTHIEPGLSNWRRQLLLLALRLKHNKGNEVIVLSTMDSDIVKLMYTHGFAALPPLFIIRTLKNQSKIFDSNAWSELTIYRYNNRIILVLILAFFGSIWLSMVLGPKMVVAFINNIGPSFVAIFSFFIGLLLFWFRSHWKLYYGCVELLFGVLIAAFEFDTATTNNNVAIGIIKVLGGIYVIVRGLDNITQGLPKNKFSLIWEGIFTKKL